MSNNTPGLLLSESIGQGGIVAMQRIAFPEMLNHIILEAHALTKDGNE